MRIIFLILFYFFSLHTANSDEILFQPWDYSLPCWRIPAAVTTSAVESSSLRKEDIVTGTDCYMQMQQRIISITRRIRARATIETSSTNSLTMMDKLGRTFESSREQTQAV